MSGLAAPLLSFDELIARVGEPHFRQRFTLQVEHASHIFDHGVHPENDVRLMGLLRFVLKATGLYRIGYRNFLDIRLNERHLALPGLPPEFDGYRLLQLSDLHLDIDPALTEAIVKCIAGADYDLAVITGDFRLRTFGPYEKALQFADTIIRALHAPAYGILGNHDFIEFVPYLEMSGLNMLLNETVTLERRGAAIYLSGVDDPHFYETDNLQRTRGAIPDQAFSILLAHSPEIYRAAAAAGYDLTLCGHTHAGQICLPGGFAPFTNARCPRRVVGGAWEQGRMQGYTSPGTGSSGVPARFFCPPEATLHVLHPG